ncbi:hypothetical protein HWC89_gp22 [Flavobacterium phage vB_FspS_hemulen6-1]|uniref:Uncharacterized protein n=3 Tax=Lillamyvirus TaxID=2843418 RepID=A0A6B9LBT1_9CAUD|nr:hypothetical protein HWC89_gp22 [Flavobacterium phage vB_FspS_hemulen6-1]YP_009855374.1 hypothetical protein HWC98_gp19 [Flavobacterium phage vB_FspS_stinky9-1]QHB38853.1 hypothetical protein hemulen62_gp022 [Flavobacterium phage vB_FspS_hemulen6-2]QHB38923.1 hypothetical protein hemulen91_gp022 [Flavobacterium phage vB_FspS_hemulen9-1]QHB38783.1 hypothetical protein hemulen61_gp022 [Flavobacterium phage vB_FspS_hemulen6-1]QHB40881.1 hypothetical protein stinky91_gp019 [Flavobacterium phage
MNKFKGTKGDFKEDLVIDLLGHNDELMQIIVFSKQVNTHSVAHVFGLTQEEVMANAKLFANSKKMLDMLIKMKNKDEWDIEDHFDLENLIKETLT